MTYIFFKNSIVFTWRLNFLFQVISQLDEENDAFKETDVDGNAAPDIIPHSSKFHIPFFIFIIREEEEHNNSLF